MPKDYENKIDLQWKSEYHHYRIYNIDGKRYQVRLRFSIHPEDPEHRVFLRAFSFLDKEQGRSLTIIESKKGERAAIGFFPRKN